LFLHYFLPSGEEYPYSFVGQKVIDIGKSTTSYADAIIVLDTENNNVSPVQCTISKEGFCYGLENKGDHTIHIFKDLKETKLPTGNKIQLTSGMTIFIPGNTRESKAHRFLVKIPVVEMSSPIDMPVNYDFEEVSGNVGGSVTMSRGGSTVPPVDSKTTIKLPGVNWFSRMLHATIRANEGKYWVESGDNLFLATDKAVVKKGRYDLQLNETFMIAGDKEVNDPDAPPPAKKKVRDPATVYRFRVIEL